MNVQAALFADGGRPQGLRYHPSFITREEEDELVSRVRKIDVQPFQFGQYEGKRRVAWFGWQYDYSDRRLKRAKDVPEWLVPFATKVEALDQLECGSIRQVVVTEYEAGAGIGWHRDKPSLRSRVRAVVAFALSLPLSPTACCGVGAVYPGGRTTFTLPHVWIFTA